MNKPEKNGGLKVPFNFDGDKPIYLQLAEAIEDDVLKGIFKEGSQIVSTTEMAVTLRINPGTANKAINRLVDEGILFKKRGLGMFVAPGAKNKIMQKRREGFYRNFVTPILDEAAKIQLTVPELITMIERGAESRERDRHQ